MNNLNNITQDWTHADQFLNDKIDKNNNSIKHDFGELTNHVNTSFESVEKDIKMLNGVAEGQFITDSDAKMVKVVPENAFKGIVSMIGGKTVNQDDVLLNAPVKKVVWESKNVLSASFVKGYYISKGSGNINVSAGWSATEDYVAIKSNTAYTITGATIVGSLAGFAFYDESKTWISSVTTMTFTTPANAKYIRICTNSETDLNVMLVEGTTAPTPYTPYNKTTLLLDKIVDKLPDYGASVNDNLYNYVDFEEMVYHHKVGSIIMGEHMPPTSSWSYISGSTRYFSDKYAVTINMKIPESNATVPHAVANKYSFAEWATVGESSNDMMMYISSTGGISVRNTKAASISELEKALMDVELNYELAEEELIPLTDLLLPFKCEPGGTVTFENEHNLDVPNSVIYEKEMK